ncbi:7908_t:CDS:1 [Funneliformis mosseae]|uniref:7908_t:CDS:1 n=1 Tax=Funneliformis mosseae TaxID=27381 RepID=A0A9N8VCD7_FUNMO|nr:7908_t:CDS:1 [Funneliformis mosseae]
MQSSNDSELKAITPMSPPLSPKKNTLTSAASNDEDESNNKSLEEQGQQLQESPQQQPNLETTSKIAFIQEDSRTTIPRKRYRMRLFEAPPELLEFIKTSEEEKNKAVISPNNKRTAVTDIVGGTNDRNGSSFATPSSHNKGRMIMTPNTTTGQQTTTRKIISDKRQNRSRKNPYPKKAPSKSSPGITLKVDVFTPFKEDPASLLKSDDPPTNSNSTSLLFSEFSSSESSPPQSPSPQRSLSKKQRKQHKTKTKRSKNHISERKRKGNSLARVMADRGLIETTFNPVSTVAGEIKQIRIPPPPPMLFDELVKSIDQLGLTTELLSKINPRINWKGQPLSISHLPHYNSLHPKEAIVASTLRLTPVQYLTAKNTLVSSARRYIQKSLPFRKSDAQKLLRIDVNKASKLWEFFMQVKWI